VPARTASKRPVAACEMTAKRPRKHGGAARSEPIVVCPECGDRFSITNEVPSVDTLLAERVTEWLLDRFVWDHIQENKHRGLIPLPTSEELIQAARSNHEQ
jgi:hypothetical protein